jgi:predicted alpha/beta superfamily hydrolase
LYQKYLYLPEDYEDNPTHRYPVLYMFDGHNVFFDYDATYGKSWGMNSYMTWSRTPMVIVAVECNHVGNGRLCEYSPFDHKDSTLGEIEGRGKLYMDWLVNDLKPFIDKKVRTLPDREHTFIAGSSMGGLMSLYAVTQYNHVFQRAACLSPSLWAARTRLNRFIKEAEVAPGTVIYMDYGSREMGGRGVMAAQFAKVTQMLLEKKVWLTTRIVPNGDHCEACWEEQLPFFLSALMYERK